MGGEQCHLADDDISLSSSIEEESKCEEDESGNKIDGDTGDNQQSKDTINNDDKDENDAGVVDLTDSPKREKSQPLQSSNKDDDDNDPQRETNNLRRLSRIAKKFKKQYLQKSAQYKEQYAEKRKLSERIRQAEGSLKEVKDQMSGFEEEQNQMRLTMNESKLDLIRIRQERDVLRARCATIHKDMTHAQSRLQECHSYYNKELEDARTKTMSEVQEIMEEHPKVVEENRVLKQRLQKLEFQRKDNRRGTSSSSSNSSSNEGSRTGRNSRNIHKALKEMDKATRFPPQQTASTKKTTAVNPFGKSEFVRRSLQNTNKNTINQRHGESKHQKPKVNSGQYSSFASRMIKASEKARKPQQGTDSKKRSSLSALSLSSQNKRMKSHSASRRDLFQRKP